MSDVPSNLIPTRITQLPLAPVASEDSLMMIVYNGNNYQIRVGDLLSVAGVPTTRQVIAGTSLTGGGQLSSNVTLSVANGGITSTQLSATGVTAGSYGDATNIPVFTVDSTGRVTAASTIAATISGYVPTTRQVIAGTGLTGGGPLNANVTLAADLSDSLPLAGLTTGSAGVATSMSRSDHKHPQVDLSSANEVENILGLSHGGTAKSIVPNAGAIIWSGADGLYVGPAGTAGQVLISGGTSAPTWGTAGTVTSVAMTVPSFLSVTGSPIIGAGTLAVSLSGTPLPVVNGGTGTTTPSLVEGANVTISGTWPNQTVNATGGGGSGTVTSVDMTVPTGLAISGNPITTSGTLTLTFASGYSIPTTANQTNWTTAYTQTQQWNGGSTNLVSATGRTSLGGTTVGQSMFTLTNPSAITFPRFNADNTVSALNAADFRTAIGAGSGGGSVTTVSVVSANGFAGTVADATTTPAITLTTSISGMLKGSASALVAATAGTDFSAGTSALATGILKSTTSTGALTIAVAADFPTLNQSTTGTAGNVTGIVAVANGGTGTTTPSLVAGTNVTISGTWPNQTVNSTGGGGGGTTGFEQTFLLMGA